MKGRFRWTTSKSPPQKLGKGAKIPVYPLGDSGEVFYELALEMVNTIKAHNAAGRRRCSSAPSAPSGSTPSSSGS